MEKKLEDFLKNIQWNTVYRQHITYAYKVLAKNNVKEDKMDTESMMSIFAKWLALIVVYDDLALYLEASKRHNRSEETCACMANTL